MDSIGMQRFINFKILIGAEGKTNSNIKSCFRSSQKLIVLQALLGKTSGFKILDLTAY
jgi:hypothetical protein